jgi:hypothetical protein
MNDASLTRILNALAARCVTLECQILALRRLLDKSNVVSDEDFERMFAKAMDGYKEFLNPERGASERLDEFLRKFEGPIQ